jgi:hypothetical protein
VAAAKAAWRRHAASLTWEEKVAAIERMRERDAVIRRVREGRAPDSIWQKVASSGRRPPDL